MNKALSLVLWNAMEYVCVLFCHRLDTGVRRRALIELTARMSGRETGGQGEGAKAYCNGLN